MGGLNRYPASRDPSRQHSFRVVSKNSSTAFSSNEGELARSITTCAPATASLTPFAGDDVDAAIGRGGEDLMAALAQNLDGLRADQPGAADNDDPSWFASLSMTQLPFAGSGLAGIGAFQPGKGA